MNKTVNINIGGLPFILDENAYEILKDYLERLERHFAGTEGNDEIMHDIEARIAEILMMKLSTAKKIIIEADVNEVIGIIGKPEEMGEGAEEGAAKDTGTDYKEYQREFFRRRIYRDGDNKTIGGVCAGLGAYFDIDPVWIRLIWAVSIFVFGAGFLLYIILWVIIPEAKTPAQKLEMRGDQYDLDSIKRSFTEEGKHFKKKVKDMAYEYKYEYKYGKNKDRFRHAGEDFLHSVSPTAKRAGNIIAKAALSLLLFVVSGIFLVVLVAIYSNTDTIHWGNNMPFETSISNFAAMFTDSDGETSLLLTGLALAVLTPLFMIIFGTIKALFGVRKKSKLVGILAGVVFWAGIIICSIEGYRIFQRLDELEKVTEVVPIQQPKHDTLFVESRLPEGSANMTELEVFDMDCLAGDDPMTFWPNADLNITRSETGQFTMKIEKRARGKNSNEARDNAGALKVNNAQADSLVSIDRYGVLPENVRWHGHDATVIIGVPIGKTIILGESTRKALYRAKNIQDVDEDKMAGHTWVMTEAGLSCKDCPADINKNNNDEDY